ncbi:MAG: hypothetical protein ACKOAG_11755, partial [Candidatus Kapaibacterium sp.]
VAIARALVTNPAIILADEPTGNLDSKTSVEIMRWFEEIWRRGNTVIVVTHEDEVARHARRIIRIRDGNVESDTVNEQPVTLYAEGGAASEKSGAAQASMSSTIPPTTGR